jgi:hypothetical protein
MNSTAIRVSLMHAWPHWRLKQGTCACAHLYLESSGPMHGSTHACPENKDWAIACQGMGITPLLGFQPPGLDGFTFASVMGSGTVVYWQRKSLIVTPSRPGRHIPMTMLGRTLKGSDRRLDRETDCEDPKEPPDVLDCVESAEASGSGGDAGQTTQEFCSIPRV